jgi:hypothetical protein
VLSRYHQCGQDQVQFDCVLYVYDVHFSFVAGALCTLAVIGGHQLCARLLATMPEFVDYSSRLLPASMMVDAGRRPNTRVHSSDTLPWTHLDLPAVVNDALQAFIDAVLQNCVLDWCVRATAHTCIVQVQ